ncbi:RNA 2'-phosphotransferase [Thermodesulfobacteriota bacterium]
MSKKNRFKIEKTSRFMVYALGHKPYEFGLVPDREGFVAIKEFLQALHEESGWGHIREGHINEILLSQNRSLFQLDEKQIRAQERHWNLDMDNPAQVLPKILYIGIRNRAHSVVLENGLMPKNKGYHILTHDIDMAKRIGSRRDNNPVVLEVMSDKAQREGVLFFQFGELFLTEELPARYIAGPPIPKAVMKAKEEKSKKREEKVPELATGTFILDQDRDMDLSRRGSGKKKKGWKEKARKIRRSKKGYP